MFCTQCGAESRNKNVDSLLAPVQGKVLKLSAPIQLSIVCAGAANDLAGREKKGQLLCALHRALTDTGQTTAKGLGRATAPH